MNKPKLLRIVNPLLAILFLSQAITVIFHDLLPYEVFDLLHKNGGWALLILAGIHVYLNWGWVKANFLNRKG